MHRPLHPQRVCILLKATPPAHLLVAIRPPPAAARPSSTVGRPLSNRLDVFESLFIHSKRPPKQGRRSSHQQSPCLQRLHLRTRSASPKEQLHPPYTSHLLTAYYLLCFAYRAAAYPPQGSSTRKPAHWLDSCLLKVPAVSSTDASVLNST